MKPACLVTLFCFVTAMSVQAKTSHPPTVSDAEAFMKKAEARLAGLSVKVNQANRVHANFITDDTEALAAAVNEENTAVTAELVEQAKRFDGLKMPADLSRKFLLLKLSLTAPGPHDPALRKEMTDIAASLESDHGKGKVCDTTGKSLEHTRSEQLQGRRRAPHQ